MPMTRVSALTLGLFLLLPGAAQAQDYLAFRSPTGNIHCAIFTGDYAGARCDLSQLVPSYRQPPPGCDLDWGASFSVAAQGRGYLDCVGDSVRDPGSFVLGYGQSVKLGAFTCSSSQSGMTCTNGQGHGFSVARAKQQLF